MKVRLYYWTEILVDFVDWLFCFRDRLCCKQYDDLYKNMISISNINGLKNMIPGEKQVEFALFRCFSSMKGMFFGTAEDTKKIMPNSNCSFSYRLNEFAFLPQNM
jgi:hypothetical protein